MPTAHVSYLCVLRAAHSRLKTSHFQAIPRRMLTLHCPGMWHIEVRYVDTKLRRNLLSQFPGYETRWSQFHTPLTVSSWPAFPVYPEEGGCMSLRNICTQLPTYKESRLRRKSSVFTVAVFSSSDVTWAICTIAPLWNLKRGSWIYTYSRWPF